MPFKKGQSGNPTGKKRPPPEPPTHLPPGDDDMMVAMRWVMNSPVDRTYQHWSYRQWLKEDAKEFRGKLAALERAQRLSKGTTGAASSSESVAPDSGLATPPDLGKARILEQLPREWELVQEYKKNREAFLEWLASLQPSSDGEK